MSLSEQTTSMAMAWPRLSPAPAQAGGPHVRIWNLMPGATSGPGEIYGDFVERAGFFARTTRPSPAASTSG